MEKAVFLRGWAEAMSKARGASGRRLGFEPLLLLLSLTLRSSGRGGSDASASSIATASLRI